MRKNAQIIRETEWRGAVMSVYQVMTDENEPVRYVFCRDPRFTGAHPVILAVHGLGSKKEEWFEKDDYTKGGNLTAELLGRGYAIVAVDLYAHGEAPGSESVTDHDTLLEGRWEEFFWGSVRRLSAVIEEIKHSPGIDVHRFGYIGYSIGTIFGFWLNNRMNLFKAMVLCVPPPFREDDDEYAPKNNCSNLTEVPILMISGESDEYFSLEDSRWLYEQIPGTKKRMITYPSGHSLPIEYVAQALDWFVQNC
ncbi:MAG: alpha/beta fold hydrolase [Chitinivibrionales bacterium]|nr:alpha/beta fold hydrolase [Chitinivibrionales bacterium]